MRNADVQVIADRAGVGKGTVYRRFGNKEDPLWAATYDVVQRLERDLFAAIDPIESPLEKLRAAGVAYAGFFEANPDYLEVFLAGRAEFHGSVPLQRRNPFPRESRPSRIKTNRLSALTTRRR